MRSAARWVVALVAGTAGWAWAQSPASQPASTSQPARVRVLLLTESLGFVHDVVKPGKGNAPSLVQQTFARLAADSGQFEVKPLASARHLTPDELAAARVVVFYTTGDLPFSDEQWSAFEQWVRDGGALLGVHAAADTLHGRPAYIALLGGEFNGHPWTANSTVTIKTHDLAHPAAAPLGASLTLKDEIYQFKNFDPAAVRVLASLDMSRTALKRPYHVPIAWCKAVGRGRVFYTSLGHRADVWTNPVYQAHLLGALRWSAGLADGDATPNPQVHAREMALAAEAAGASSQPAK